MNRLFFIIVLHGLLSAVYAQNSKQKINIGFAEVLETKNPLLLTNNPAAISYNRLDSLVVASARYTYSEGDYKRSMEAQRAHVRQVHTESYRRINDTFFYGAFSVNKNTLKQQSYSNNYNPYRATPYQFCDSLEQNNTDQEQYRLQTTVAHTLNQYLSIGGDLDYTVGLIAQDHDPRSENKIDQLHSNIGLLANGEMMKLGLNAHYTYYDEDIDIEVIEKNAHHSLFALKGLGNYEGHRSSSFYRQYKSNTWGVDAQLELYNNLLEVGTSHGKEMVYDGRRNNSASWSAIKTDAELNTNHRQISNIYTLEKGHSIQQFKLSAMQDKYLGTEYLQNLELQNSLDNTYQWHTLLKEDKYYKEQQKLAFNYSFSNYKSDFLRNYSLHLGVYYTSQKEQYNFLDQENQASNLIFELNTSKLFTFRDHSLDFIFNFVIQNNKENIYDRNNNNFITTNITYPDYYYLISDYITYGATINYTHTTSQKRNYFISTSLKNQHSKNQYYAHTHRLCFDVKLGLMF